MKYSRHSLLCRIAGLAALIGAAIPAYAHSSEDVSKPQVLAAYVARPDESFAWREVASGRIGSAQYVEYMMTSQTWRGIVWKHQLFVLQPANAAEFGVGAAVRAWRALEARVRHGSARRRISREKRSCSSALRNRYGLRCRAAPGSVRADIRPQGGRADRLHVRSVSSDRR